MMNRRTYRQIPTLALLLSILLLAGSALALAQATAAAPSGNRPERLEWFQDLGLGLFIHWGVDSQLGSVISHSMVGASDDYLRRFVEELPRTFAPGEFHPRAWARLARTAGFRYVVFTTKHHSGFCMFDTATTDFSVMNTPYGKDITREVVDAFRAEGLAIGFYFSPDDFHFLYRQGTRISRRRPEAQPPHNPELMAHDQAQVRELLTHYGPIDIAFFDGPAEGLVDLAWELQPNLVVTRGAMTTPEISASTTQTLPGQSLQGPWEACFTMGTSWQIKPTNETYRSAGDLIRQLIETRAKGGTMLLNVGPTAEGVNPPLQEGILREIGLWMFVNREAVYDVRPWVMTHEGDFWFTCGKEAGTVYAIDTGAPWPWGIERTITLRQVRLARGGEVALLGQNDEVLEYQPDVVPRTRWSQDADGLRITATRSQRLYNDRSWPNPVVLRLTLAQPASPPQ